jgi:hypothetical protein
MTIRHFIPLALLVIGGLTYGAGEVGVPAPPVAVITTFASVLLALQLEDRKLADMLGELIQAFRSTSGRA